MWYAGYDGAHMKIGYATSADGVVWEKYAANPVLELGDSDTWDAEGVSSPTVVYDGRQYRVWYAGYGGGKMRIGYAASSDGIVWETYPANPVLELGDDGFWDAMGASSPAVVLGNDTYRIWYTGYDGDHMRIGYATSRRLGDISGDGTISPYDAALILRFVVGIIDAFPAQELSVPKGVQTLPSYRVRLPQLSAREGEWISVPVTVEDATGLFAGGICVAYDPTVLKAVDVSSLSLLSGSYWQGNTDLDGEVRLAFAAITPLGEGGDLFTVTFEVLSDTEGKETSLVLSDVEFNDSVPVHRGHGSVRVLPSVTQLMANYPNPFNPETTIAYNVAKTGTVRLSVYALTGQHIRTLMDGERPAGSYSVVWNGTDDAGRGVASGVYLCRMEAGEYSAVRKLVLVR